MSDANSRRARLAFSARLWRIHVSRAGERWWLPLCALVLLFASAGCPDKSQWSGVTPTPDFEQFKSDVYPMLLRNCAFTTCHGDPHRFFQVYGPGRTRLDAKVMPSDPPTDIEVERSYERARSMLAEGGGIANSALLRKPLEESQGGQGHRGVDSNGHNVFASKSDPDYVLLVDWAATSAKAQQNQKGAKP